jgi:hypothetical protein
MCEDLLPRSPVLIRTRLVVEAAVPEGQLASFHGRGAVDREHGLRALRAIRAGEPSQRDLAVGFERQESPVVGMAFAFMLDDEE